MGVDVKGMALQKCENALALENGFTDLVAKQGSGLGLGLEVDERRQELLGVAFIPTAPASRLDPGLHPGKEPRQTVDVPKRREVAGHPDVSLFRRGDHSERG